MGTKKKEKNRSFVVADAVGISHFVVANFCIVLGNLTDIFKEVAGGAKYPGLAFVYKYFDAPVAAVFSGLVRSDRGDLVYTFLVAELIIIVSSIFYAILAFIFIKILFALLE